MKPIITDEDTGDRLLTAAECAEVVGVAPSTWRAYVAARGAPKPIAALNSRTPLWLEREVLAWKRDERIT